MQRLIEVPATIPVPRWYASLGFGSYRRLPRKVRRAVERKHIVHVHIFEDGGGVLIELAENDEPRRLREIAALRSLGISFAVREALNPAEFEIMQRPGAAC